VIRTLILAVVLIALIPGTLVGGERKVKALPPSDFYPATFVLVRETAPPDSGQVGRPPVFEAKIVEDPNQADLEGAPPECTPFRASVDATMEEVRFEDPNDAWPVFFMNLKAWQRLIKYTTMKECLESLPKYKGRYTEDQIRDLEKGKVTAGMPYEFALMVLGEPEGPPSYLSILNPVTQRAEEFWSYSWVNVGEGAGVAAFFGFLGAGALGFAGSTNNLGDMSKYLKIAAIAQVAEAVAWHTALSRAQFVNVQVSSTLTIHAVLAQ
jgi:hypothetical protein